MRFSTLVLILALPAAAYAAACSEQLPVGHKYFCSPRGSYCDIYSTCCEPFECVNNGWAGVRPQYIYLPFADGMLGMLLREPFCRFRSQGEVIRLDRKSTV